MAKKVTLKNIMEQLKALKKLALKDLQIDIEDMNFDKKVYEKVLKKSKKIFETLKEWKTHIWDECSNKKAVSKKGKFEYDCKLTKRACKFEHCPLNIQKQ